ncbi:MAG: hypothetical protein HC922_03590 [Leptolyngbyaceae cyanobacterium SM2_3_12]|nr:hypothetical protein [Leptolyngbyaceae cyanobacterium SM2_3_12]
MPLFTRRYRQNFFLAALAGVISLWLSLGVPVIAQPTPESSAPADSVHADSAPADSAPVTLGGETLFTLQEKQSNDSVEERADRISVRLEEAAQDQTLPVEAIALSETEIGTAIYSEDGLIMAVSEADAARAGIPRQTLAEQYLGTMQTQIQAYRTERSAEYLSRAAVIAVLCTLGLVLAILVLANVMPQFYRWLDRQQDRWIPNVRIQNFELLTAHQLTALVQGFTKILHFVLVTTLILSYLSYVLSLFPQTRQVGQSVFDHVWGAWQIVWEGFVAYLPNLLSIALIVFLTAAVLRFARLLFSNLRRGRLSIPGFYPEWALPTYRLVQFLAFAFALAVIFPYLPGANSPAFQGVSIFFGLLVSLGGGRGYF